MYAVFRYEELDYVRVAANGSESKAGTTLAIFGAECDALHLDELLHDFQMARLGSKVEASAHAAVHHQCLRGVVLQNIRHHAGQACGSCEV